MQPSPFLQSIQLVLIHQNNVKKVVSASQALCTAIRTATKSKHRHTRVLCFVRYSVEYDERLSSLINRPWRTTSLKLWSTVSVIWCSCAETPWVSCNPSLARMLEIEWKLLTQNSFTARRTCWWLVIFHPRTFVSTQDGTI